ncbi:MAG TPA: biotin--[acetyl-CoA-carboxylase] ligase, partial [Candidatus Sulfotelmatobacter sp.]|nr:biotin--[acetyl-CoA-carboxylase] ligase [Candidatus Sulfotelmatobacter sp.]
MIVGKKILHYSTLDSTNAEARRLIKKGEGEGLVVVAGAQAAGRGKPGRRWHSPLGNVYFSAVLKPYKNPRELAPITLLGALAARAALKKTANLPVVIKWPNDLLVHGRKVGGILTERLTAGQLIVG